MGDNDGEDVRGWMGRQPRASGRVLGGYDPRAKPPLTRSHE